MGASLNRTVFVGAMFLTAGTAIQAGVGVVTSLLLARLVGPEAFGHFAAVISTIGLTMTVLTLRLSVLITRASDEELAGGLARTYSAALLLETALSAILAWLWIEITGLASGWAMTLVLSQALLHWISVNKAFYERSMAYKRLAAAETTAIITGHMIALVAAFAGLGEASLYLRELVTAILLTVVLAAVGALTFPAPRLLSLCDLRALLQEARPVWLDGVLEGSFHRLTTLVAYTLAQERDTGFFFMAQSLVMRAHQLMVPVIMRVASNWFRSIGDVAQKRWARDRLLLWTGFPLLLLSIAIATLAEKFIPLLLGPAWDGAIPVVVAMSAVVVCVTLFEIMRGYGLIMRREGDILYARSAQYGAFALTLLVSSGTTLPPVVALGVAVSGSFAAACLVLWLRQRRHRSA